MPRLTRFKLKSHQIMGVLVLLNRRLTSRRYRASSRTSCLSAAQCLSLSFITCFRFSCFLSKLLLGLLVAVADHTVEEAIWSTHWVLVAFFLGIVDFFVDVSVSFLVGRGDVIVEFSWKGGSVFSSSQNLGTIDDGGRGISRVDKAGS